VAREAARGFADDNARVELPREVDDIVEPVRRLLAGRDGRLVLTLVLAMTPTFYAASRSAALVGLVA